MPNHDLFTNQTQEKLREEKAIVNAVTKYFETAPYRRTSTKEDTESIIIKAFHKYFVKK